MNVSAWSCVSRVHGMHVTHVYCMHVALNLLTTCTVILILLEQVYEYLPIPTLCTIWYGQLQLSLLTTYTFTQEAAIYLKEGIENERLCHHPTDSKSFWAYMAIHHPAYYITEVIVCVLLMFLAFIEKPSCFPDMPVEVSIFMHVCT